MKIIEHTIDTADAGRKLKYFVRGTLGVSYAQYCAARNDGGILINGLPARANDILRAQDLLTLRLREAGANKAVEVEALPVELLYEDEDLYILSKPAPLACQSTPKQPGGTLENRLFYHYRAEENFVFRPLNRLDRGTSGLMAAARHAHAAQLMQRALHTPDFVREYLAIVEGEMTGSGTIDLPIAKEDAASVRRVIDAGRGCRAVTHYRAEAFDGRRTRVRLRLETGRTHQIRVHLSALGHPVTGDFLYGCECPELPGRFALHSTHIELRQPLTGQRISIDSPLPAALQALMRDV